MNEQADLKKIELLEMRNIINYSNKNSIEG